MDIEIVSDWLHLMIIFLRMSELTEKITDMLSHPGFVIKYQVFPEDLDALVSVRSDEDLQHMVEEYDRHDSLPRSPSSSSRFHIFLFPSPGATPPCTSPTYLDSANASISLKGSLSIPIPSRPPMFTFYSSSACSSPPDSSPVKGFGLLGLGPKSGKTGMQRVRSTPNLSGSSGHFGNNHSGTNLSPRGGGGGFYSPHHHHHHHQQPHQNKGMMGYGCSTGMRRMGGSGFGFAFSGHQSQRRYYCPPSGGHPWGCRGGGHGEETPTPRSSHSSINGSGTPPIVPKKSIWD